MFPTPAPVRRHWRRSKRTAQALTPVRRFLPTNQIRDAVMTRRGLKWGVPAMLLAIPCIYIAATCRTLIEQGGPGWLHLIVLVCIWNALKMLWLGPVSLVLLARARRPSARSSQTLPAGPRMSPSRGRRRRRCQVVIERGPVTAVYPAYARRVPEVVSAVAHMISVEV